MAIGRRGADDRLLQLLACGATVVTAATQAGVSEATVYRRLADKEFSRKLQAIRADMVQRASGALTAAGTESVRTLLELQKSSVPPATRLGAAKATLELGMKVRETAELEQRLAALEDQVAANSDDKRR
jgi:AcrR family transcriptional regulator